MHVDVDLLRLDFEEKERRRVAAFLNAPVVGIEHSEAERAAIDWAAVNEGDELAAGGAPHARLGGQTAQAIASLRVADIHWDQIIRQAAPPDLSDAIAQVFAGGRLEDGASALQYTEGYLWMRHREEACIVSDVRCLGGVGLEELASCRHGVEELRHLDHGAHWHPAVFLFDQLAAVDLDLGAVLPALGACAHGEARDRGDGWQCLAAKAEAGDFVQIRGFADLTGGVALQREQGLVRTHALAVVLDPDVGFAAVAELHLDAAGSCVDRVFHEFFDHSNRTLNYLACGDLIGDSVG